MISIIFEGSCYQNHKVEKPFSTKPQEIFKGKNLNEKTNVEGKTSGQEKTCKEQVLNSNSSTQGKSGFQESVYGTGTGLFCKPKSHIRWIPKTLLFAESCPLTAIPALSSKYGPTCMAGSRHAYSSNSNTVNSTSGVKKKKSFPNPF